jgi:hypothetical protein
MPSTHHMKSKRSLLLPALLLTPALATPCAAALVSGDIAIIGYTDNGAPDSFRIAALAPLGAGEVIYFTDNGWSSSLGTFRGASGTDGDGNEGLIALTINNPVAAGTIIGSPVNGTDWTWSVSGAVPGGTSGAFANLAFATGGEQMTAFQAPVSLPLFNPSTMLYQVDNTGAYEDATSSATGLLAPGLIAGSTGLLLPGAGFLSGTYGLNSSDPDVTALQTSGGTKTQWLSVISDSSNWMSAPTVPGSLNLSPVPEAGSAVLSGFAALALLRRRRS